MSPSRSGASRFGADRMLPLLVIVPSLAATLVYVFGFTLWTAWISLSNSTLLPDYTFLGLRPHEALWSSKRWLISFSNLFVFSTLYVAGSMALGLLIAILIDQRLKFESVWRAIFLYPLAVSFVVTGTVWRWILSPATGIEAFARDMGWLGIQFDWLVNRDKAIYVIVMVGVWHVSGFVIALFLAGLRSVDQDLVKAAQIDGAGIVRIYRRIVLPSIKPIFAAVLIILLQFAIKTFDLVMALTGGGPGLATNVPSIYVYDMIFQRGQIAQGAAAALMILAALTVVIVPYALYTTWQKRKEARHV